MEAVVSLNMSTKRFEMPDPNWELFINQACIVYEMAQILIQIWK